MVAPGSDFAGFGSGADSMLMTSLGFDTGSRSMTSAGLWTADAAGTAHAADSSLQAASMEDAAGSGWMYLDGGCLSK